MDSESETSLWESVGKQVAALALAAGVALASPGVAEIASAVAVTAPVQHLTQEERQTVGIFKNNTPSVVFITNLAYGRDAFTLDAVEAPQGAGSGFVWDKQGHVVTNYHVIRGASDLRVSLGAGPDMDAIPAKVIGFDEDKDIAVLKIDAPQEKLRPVKIGTSEGLEVGMKVFAIGNPFGLDHTLTVGVISGMGREIQSGNTGRPIDGIIQTDAAINPGNSGGPLLNSQGQFIGINTAIYSASGTSSGVGFALPADLVNGVVDQIIKFGRVTRPILGISFAPDVAAEQLGLGGVLVLDAKPGGPAAKAGIRSTKRDEAGRLILGDIITGMNGTKVSSSSDLYRILDKCNVGETVKVEVNRGLNSSDTVDVTLEDIQALPRKIKIYIDPETGMPQTLPDQFAP